MFRIAIHANLAFEGPTAFRVSLHGRLGSMTVRPQEGSRAFSYTGADYSWAIGGEGWNSLAAVLAPLDGSTRVPNREIRFLKDQHYFTGGVIDHTRYALLEISTELAEISELEDEGTSEDLMSWAEAVARQFVDWYRWVTGQSDVRHLSHIDSPAIEVWKSQDARITDDETVGHFTPHKQTFRWILPEESGRIKKPLSREQLATLSDAMRAGAPAPLHSQLLISAKEMALAYKHHAVSIVLSCAACEAAARDAVATACQRKKRTTLPSGRGKQQRRLPVDTAIEKADLLEELLGEYPRLLSGTNVRSTSEYNSWFEACYKPRRVILHRGTVEFAEADARRAFETTVTLVNRLHELLR